MKLATLALASAFALSSTFALATTTTHHHKYKSGARTTQGMNSNARANGTPGTPSGGWYGPTGGLVGGSDNGVNRTTR
jgi:hypothetical protein